MKVVCIGGGPAGLYFAISMKLRDPAHEVAGARAQPPRRHLRLGRGVLRRDPRQSRGRTMPRARPRSSDAFQHWDDIDVHFKGHVVTLRRPRLRRHRAQAAAQHPAGAGARSSASSCGSKPRSRTSDACRDADLIVAADGINSRIRSQLRRRLQAEPRAAQEQVHLARHAPGRSTPSPSSSRRPSTAGSGRTPTASMPTPRPSSSSATRRPGGRSASTR